MPRQARPRRLARPFTRGPRQRFQGTARLAPRVNSIERDTRRRGPLERVAGLTGHLGNMIQATEPATVRHGRNDSVHRQPERQFFAAGDIADDVRRPVQMRRRAATSGAAHDRRNVMRAGGADQPRQFAPDLIVRDQRLARAQMVRAGVGGPGIHGDDIGFQRHGPLERRLAKSITRRTGRCQNSDFGQAQPF